MRSVVTVPYKAIVVHPGINGIAHAQQRGDGRLRLRRDNYFKAAGYEAD